MPTIYIGNKPYQVKAGINLLQACLSLKFNVPYFCWHPAMNSVGACRLCAVKQFSGESDTKGKIIMSCMTPVADGLRISVDDPEVKKFRKNVLEWLMINHPHDCPVCDEGGECHLQDMTLMTGQIYRRYRFKKRTHHNQNLGPFVTHEMNRCIQCYRCVRFYNDYAGGRDFGVFNWHDNVYFGRYEDGILQSEFSGNLIEVCPTGVFNDKIFARHYTRKWDLQAAPSICAHCSLGCNTLPGERYGTLRRVINRFNSEINGYFLCDRGRFGYEFANSAFRVKQPLCRKSDGIFEAVSKEAILNDLRALLKDRHRIIGIGSSRASLESNFALRTLVGSEKFHIDCTRAKHELFTLSLDILRKSPVCSASVNEVGLADAVLILGEDIPNVAPILSLALRQAVLRKPAAIVKELHHIEEWNDAAVREALQREKGPLFIATTDSTRIDDIATTIYRAAPDDIARLGFAVANEIDSACPVVSNVSEDMYVLARKIATELKNSERPVIISGVTCGSANVVKAAADVAYALQSIGKVPKICFTAAACNSIGLGLMGGKPLESAIEAVQNGSVDTIIILENDIYRNLDNEIADELLASAKNVIAIDYLKSSTTSRAGFVLPAAAFAEGCGTLVNNEGRAQRFFSVFKPDGDIADSWRWIGDIMRASGFSGADKWQNLDCLITDLVEKMPVFAGIRHAAPSANFRITGQKIPRQFHRHSGRTAMGAHIDVNEPKPADDADCALSFSMEGFTGQPPLSLITHFWSPGLNSVQAVNKFQSEIAGPLHSGDPGKRLIEPAQAGRPAYFAEIPQAFQPRQDELLIVPAWHIFGSEELSVLSPGIAELSAKPYLAVNPKTASDLIVDDSGMAEIVFEKKSYRLPVKFSNNLPAGIVAAPVGLRDLQWNGLPIWCKLLKKA